MSLNIEYKKVEFGWIEILLSDEDNNTFDIDISNVYDPFEDWFYALERIYRCEPPSIIINPEGRTYRIDIISEYNTYKFKVMDHEDNTEYFSCLTTKEEIIEQMYGKLMQFIHSDKYDPNQYEDSYGFPLSSYKNETLERYLEGRAFDESTVLTKCRYCEQSIEVKTINDMLQRAYDIIDNDTKVKQLLNDLKLDKYNVGITQEYTRFKKLSNPHKDYISDYRAIQETQSGVYFGFNENFTILEVIEVLPYMFRNNHIRGYKAQFNDLSHKQKLEFLENAFSNYDSKLNGLSSYVEIRYLKDFDDIEIVLKMPNERVSKNYAYAFYPENKEYPYFEFDIDHKTKDGKLNSIKLWIDQSDEINEPVSKWLHQKIIAMYPDYGGCFLWFEGACGSLLSIKGYELEGTQLAQKLEDWQEIFEDSFSKKDTDWVEFDKVGRELFEELREVIKNDYILTYSKSYEETCGTNAEREEILTS